MPDDDETRCCSAIAEENPSQPQLLAIDGGDRAELEFAMSAYLKFALPIGPAGGLKVSNVTYSLPTAMIVNGMLSPAPQVDVTVAPRVRGSLPKKTRHFLSFSAFPTGLLAGLSFGALQ